MVGKRYEAAVRLSATAAGNWSYIDGTYSGQGVDLLTLPFDRFLNVIFTWSLNTMHDAEERRKWLAELDGPLPGQAHRHSMDAQAEIDQLNNL